MSQNRFDIHESINGDYVVGFTNVKELKSMGWMDSAKVSTYLMEDGKDSHRKHLGLINLFATSHKKSMPFLKDLFQGAAVLEVEEGQSITYDLPVDRSEVKCYTAEDTSAEFDFPGIDGGIFVLVLNQEFTKGDILGYDFQYGEQVMVSSEHDVEQVGENFRHFVTLQTNDKAKWFPKEKLKAGIEWAKLTNKIAEFDTAFGGISLVKDGSGTITNEFLLADPRSVETTYTAKAARMKSAGLTAFAEKSAEKIAEQVDKMGGKNMMFYAKKDASGNLSPAMIGTTLEYLALMELSMMETNELLFAKSATVNTANGVKRVNEGVWHQIRRGKLIKYSRTGGITLDHLYEAASYVYQNSDIPVSERTLKFKGGHLAHQNLLHLFRENAISQLNGIPAGMLGADSQIPGKLFTGSLDSLQMGALAITAVFLPGIGKVVVEHDPSLDYTPMSDRFSSGFYGESFAHTSNSLVIWDVTKSEYSNVDKVKGASLVDGGSKTANIYYVKPADQPHVTFGYEQGRMANGSQYENVQSSLKHMGRNFWAYSQSSALVLDTTRYVTIELQEKGRGY
jgi:hypothetical protein